LTHHRIATLAGAEPRGKQVNTLAALNSSLA
jgi:hypothetical protein